MVVIVRCNDGTCSVALMACLEGLIREGLISAYLDKEEWVDVPGGFRAHRVRSTKRLTADLAMAAVA